MCDDREPLRPWEEWLNNHEYIVWPLIGGASLLLMFWLVQYA